MNYLLLPRSPWCFVFYTSLSRQEGLEILEELHLPIGGPEDNERDGVLGLFSTEDMREEGESGELILNLDLIWEILDKEAEYEWGVHNTIVLSSDPEEMVKQPSNFVHLPRLDRESATHSNDDMFLLLVIAVLKDLENQTNFANHVRDFKYNDPQIWTSKASSMTRIRNSMLSDAVRICASDRISIKAQVANEREAA
ncbi:hypothetical protein JCM16303_005985 [Sporobolomyces ruberrimus]